MEELEDITILRECIHCGAVALHEEDLENFEIGSRSLYGRRNCCKACASRRIRGGGDLKPKRRTCTACRVTYEGHTNILKNFRRTTADFNQVVGGLCLICKSCELKKLGGVVIDGKRVPKEAFAKPKTLISKPVEAQ